MNKDNLISIFRTAHNNCKLVYASMIICSHDDLPSFYREWSAALNIPKPHDDLEIYALLQDRKVFKIAFSQLYDTVHRAALKELFEITKDYCKTTSQESILTSQPWYQFWRMLRNCLSHDFKFTFSAYDKKKLPVTWRGVTIDLALEGKPLTHGVFEMDPIGWTGIGTW